MGKLVEKVVVEKLSRFCEMNFKLYQSQMGAQKGRYAIDTIVIIVWNIFKIWKKKKIAVSLLMDVKRAFDYVFRVKLT